MLQLTVIRRRGNLSSVEHVAKPQTVRGKTTDYHMPFCHILPVLNVMSSMSHIVNSCPLTKFDGGLLRLHEADEAAVDWLTTYGSQHRIIMIILTVNNNNTDRCLTDR